MPQEIPSQKFLEEVEFANNFYYIRNIVKNINNRCNKTYSSPQELSLLK